MLRQVTLREFVFGVNVDDGTIRQCMLGVMAGLGPVCSDARRVPP